MPGVEKEFFPTSRTVRTWLSSYHSRPSVSPESSSPSDPRPRLIIDTTVMATFNEVDKHPPIKPSLIAPHNSLNSEYRMDEISPLELPGSLASDDDNPFFRWVDLKPNATFVSGELRVTTPGSEKPSFDLSSMFGLAELEHYAATREMKRDRTSRRSYAYQIPPPSPALSNRSSSISSECLEESARDKSSVPKDLMASFPSYDTSKSETDEMLLMLLESLFGEDESAILEAYELTTGSHLVAPPSVPPGSAFERVEWRSVAYPEAVLPPSTDPEQSAEYSTFGGSISQEYASNDDDYGPVGMQGPEREPISVAELVETGNVDDDYFSASISYTSARSKPAVYEVIHDLRLSNLSTDNAEQPRITTKQILDSTEDASVQVDLPVADIRDTIGHVVINDRQCHNEVQSCTEHESVEIATKAANKIEASKSNIGSSIDNLPNDTQPDERQRQRHSPPELKENHEAHSDNSSTVKCVNTMLIDSLKDKIRVAGDEVLQLKKLKHKNEEEIQELTQKIHELEKNRRAVDIRLQAATRQVDQYSNEIMQIKALDRSIISISFTMPTGTRY